MIILDEEDQQKQLRGPYTGGLSLRFPEKAALRSDLSLPDYEASEARQKLIEKESFQQKWIDYRLWRPILYALGIYVLLSIIIGVPILVVKRRREIQGSHEDSWPNPSWVTSTNSDMSVSLSDSLFWMLQERPDCDSNLIRANKFSPLTSKVARTIDYPESFHIHSNITGTTLSLNYFAGHLTVDLNPDPSVSQTILQVEVSASSSELLHDTNACYDNSGFGVRLYIFVSRQLKNPDFLGVDIKILLPKNGSSLQIKNFSTHLPWFSHTFGDLGGHVTFDKVIVEGAGYDIISKSLNASKISVKNAYASIRGVYHATHSLTLDGIKGNIIANVTLERDSSTFNPTYLTLGTGDGSINARVTLVTSTSARPLSGYVFVANVQTFNAPLKLIVANAPSTPPVPLRLNVQNNNGSAVVVLDKNYQGTFYAEDRLETVTVEQTQLPPSADPLGLGRLWSVEYEQLTPAWARGWVGWGPRFHPANKANEGQVEIRSSLSPITLQLGVNT